MSVARGRPSFTTKKFWTTALGTFVYSAAIAGLLTLIWERNTLWENLIFSQCIGFSIFLVDTAIDYAYAHRVKSGIKRSMIFFGSLPVSIAIGVSIAFRITGVGNWQSPLALYPMVIGLFFGAIASIVFILLERIELLNLEVRDRQLAKAESERREVEAQLKLLQAQIEPHFLFNTLANVASLIDGDPGLAKRLLERINDWLRVALMRARSTSATLGDELAMLENYLEIMKIRFGDRLRWAIDVPADLRRVVFPPMLLQPLLENAVRHGIEPKLGGGEILIRGHAENGALRIEVRDTGVGLDVTSNGNGAGLANVRDRLAALFGEAGKLTVAQNEDAGVTASLVMPR